jgi:hypothetical protein
MPIYLHHVLPSVRSRPSLSVCLSIYIHIGAVATGLITVKFDIGDFHDICRENPNFVKIERIGTVREDLRTFLDACDINVPQHTGVKHSIFYILYYILYC